MLHLCTLGELRLNGPAGELLAGRRKELALLAYLAQRAPRPVRRAELIDLLWGEREEQRARHSLRQALLMLRRTIGDGLTITPGMVTLETGIVELDLAAFEAAASAGRLREAVDLWRGDFLPATEDVGGEAYRLWIEAERERARRRVAETLERLIAAAEAAGDRPSAIAWAERWAELLPLDEGAYRRLVEELYLDGRSEAAQARCVEYAARLGRELGVEPSRAFVALAQRIERQELPDPVSLAGTGSAALFTPDLVGRDAARAELRRAWQLVVGGGVAVVAVEGAEGMGKTLVCGEFVRALEDEAAPLLVLQARAREEGTAAAGGAARELFGALVAAPGLVGAPELALAELTRLLPELRDRWPQLPEPRGSEQALHDATTQALAAVAQELPVVLFLDDFPFADGETGRLILALARHPPPGLLLLLTARTDGSNGTETLTDLRRLPGVRHLKLPPLGIAEIEALLGSMLELPVVQRQPLAARLHAETGGNPFFVTEIVSAMVDEGHLAPDARGIWRTNPVLGGEPLPLPSSVGDAIGRRLARLGDAARRVAAGAAVLGEPIAPAALSAATGLPPEILQTALDELLARRLLRYAPASPDALEFVHPIIRRAAQERLGAARRPTLPAPRSRRRALRVVLAGLAVATVLAIGAALVLRNGPLPSVPTLAVGQLDEQAGADSLAVAAPLGDMLATNLARVPGLPVISRARLYEILGQLGGRLEVRASVADAARRAGAVELLEGTLESARDGQLRLVLRRMDLVTGAVQREYTIAGSDAFQLADRATVMLAASLGLSAGPLRVADVSTSSLSAYRAYEEGLRRFAVGDYHGALGPFDSALAQDSLFAMAALYAWHSGTMVNRPTPAASLARLDNLASRAADRERLLIRTEVAFASNDPRFSAFAETLSVGYQVEPEGHLMFGRARVDDADFLGAIPHFRRVIAMDSLALRGGGTLVRCLACVAYGEIAGAYVHADSVGAAERVVREWMGRQPGVPDAWRWLGLTLAMQDRFEEAAAALRAAGASSRPDVPAIVAFYPVIFGIRAGDFAAVDSSLFEVARRGTPGTRLDVQWYRIISLRTQGRLRDALTETGRLARLVPPDVPSTLHRAQILFELGRYREAAHVFDSLATFPPTGAASGRLARHKSWMLVHLATTLAAAGDTAALKALLEPLRAWGSRSGFGRDRRLHHHANGLLLAARGRLEDAAAEFQRAIYSSTQGYTRSNYELARVLLALGRPRDAVAVLGPALRGPLDGSNLYVTRTELQELLGQALDAAGEPDKASAHFRKALAAWRAADPQFLARREAIRVRLTALGGRSSSFTPRP